MKNIYLSTFYLFFSILLIGQKPDKPSSGEIYRSIEKLNFLGSALYIAAHPDDENTRLISHLSNEVMARTAYLSLTRGDGGQNRIGPEIRELLGVIRTQELLGARSIDGGGQYFSRANDFGYSKHPDETLAIWNKDEVLSDVVWVIRNFKPDIIVNRFDHRTPGRTHGHHTSSAMLSVEAFDLTNNRDKYSKQLAFIDPWQTSRVFHNTSWWFYGSRANFEKADKTNLIAVDIGGYMPILGKSNSEIAARSRSMHKSQGFGATGTRGTEMEYLELIKGELPKDKENLFDGINTTWSRVSGAAYIEGMIITILDEYDFTAPHNSIDGLIKVKKEIEKINDKHWKNIKLHEIDNIIIFCTGTFLEVVSEHDVINPGDDITFKLEAVNRSPSNVQLTGISSTDLNVDTTIATTLESNQNVSIELTYESPNTLQYTNPYWLNKPGTLGMYSVDDLKLRGTPQNRAPVSLTLDLQVNDELLRVERDIVYKYNDAVDGEVYKPLSVLPRASVSIDQDVYIFPDRIPKLVTVKVKAYDKNVNGELKMITAPGWTFTPLSHQVNLEKKGQEAFFTFNIKGPVLQDLNLIRPSFTDSHGTIYKKEVVELDYDHVPFQTVIRNSEAKVVKLAIKRSGDKIAYIEGAGDQVAASLRQIGYQVDEYHPNELTSSTLNGYDACIVGIRAFNVHPILKLKSDILFKYAEDGGNVIVQYQTNRGLNGTEISPLPLELSRDRVTDEHSIISFEETEHPVINFPNTISSRDFDNWVQERGLYFAKEWDSNYSAVLGMSDKGEPMSRGSLLIAPYGKGHYIISGISFFRQLPAGVPGAYRLLANMLSVNDAEISVNRP